MPDLDSAQQWATALNDYMHLTEYSPDKILALGRDRGTLCAVTLDLDHPDTDLEARVVVSRGGWVVGYDTRAGAWTVR